MKEARAKRHNQDRLAKAPVLRDLATYIVWLLRLNRLAFASTLALICLSSVVDGLGLAFLPPILNAVGVNGSAPPDVYTTWVISTLAGIGLPPTLAFLIGLFFIAATLRVVFAQLQSVYIIKLDQISTSSLRAKLFSSVMGSEWRFLCRCRSGELNHILSNEITRVGQITFLSLLLFSDCFLGGIYIAMTFIISPFFALVTLLAAATLILLLRGSVSGLHDAGADFSAATKRLFSGSGEVLQHIKTTKTYSAETRSLSRFRLLNAQVVAAAENMSRRQAVTGAYFETGALLILCMSIYVIFSSTGEGATSILIEMLIYSRLMPYLQSGHKHYRDLVGVLPSFTVVTNQIEACLAASEDAHEADSAVPDWSNIYLRSVHFEYTRERPALCDVNLSIPAGKVVALVGPSGAGKSTIVDVIIGLISPQRGSLEVGSLVIDKDHVKGWRKQVGYVSQDTVMFNESIRSNMLWAKPDASEEAIYSALDSAGAMSFVRKLSDGLDSIAGDRGALFSHGERQRLALARAMLRRPSLLVLDEATNGLDTEIESQVMAQVRLLSTHTTVLIVAHRRSTIRWADIVYVVDGGTIVETGTWDDLQNDAGSRFLAICEA